MKLSKFSLIVLVFAFLVLTAQNAGAFGSGGSGGGGTPTLSCGQDTAHACGYNKTTNTWSNQAIVGSGGVSTGVLGNSALYDSTSTAGPVPLTFHTHPYMASSPDALHAMQQACYAAGTNGCDYIVDSSDTVILSSPFSWGGASGGTGIRPELLQISAGGAIKDNDITPGNLDDALVELAGGSLYCEARGQTNHFTGVEAVHPGAGGAGTQTNLDSVFTTAGGVIPNVWEPSHAYLAGQFVLDSNGNAERVEGNGAGTSSAGGAINAPTDFTWPAAINGTVVDGTVTWRRLSTGNLAVGAPRFVAVGCEIRSDDHSNIKHTIRLSGGSSGGSSVYQNIDTAIQGATARSAMNLIDAGTAANEECEAGNTGYAYDAFGLVPHDAAHYRACCTIAGKCTSGAATNEALTLSGLFFAPVYQKYPDCPAAIQSGGTTCEASQKYLVQIHGLVSEAHIDAIQGGDQFVWNAAALLECDGNATNITISNSYFENAIGQTTGADMFLNNGCKNVVLDNDRWGGAGTGNLNAYDGAVFHNMGAGNAVGSLSIRNNYVSSHTAATMINDALNPFSATSVASHYPTAVFSVNSECTALNTPVACCSGAGTGSCGTSGPQCDGQLGGPLNDPNFTNPATATPASCITPRIVNYSYDNLADSGVQSSAHLIHGVLLAAGVGPEAYYSGAGSTAIPTCSANWAGVSAWVSDMDACVAGEAYVAASGALKCQVQCPIAGSGSWLATGTPGY